MEQFYSFILKMSNVLDSSLTPPKSIKRWLVLSFNKAESVTK